MSACLDTTVAGFPVSALAGCGDTEYVTLDPHVEDNSPFDEPPLSSSGYSISDKYRMQAIAFYQSFYRSSAAEKDELMGNSLVGRDERKLSYRRCPSDLFAADDSTVELESPAEYSDVSSVTSREIRNQNTIEHTPRGRERFIFEKSYALCSEDGDLDGMFCLPVSSFRSKPLPKPVIWKEYTSLKDVCFEACQGKFNDNSSCTKNGDETNEVHSIATKSTMMEVPNTENEMHFFDIKSFQNYLESAKVSAQHFLKTQFFADDPEFCISKGNGDDVYSLDDSTILSSLSVATE